LQTILAMPFALDGTIGRTVIEAHGVAHTIEFIIDHVHRVPLVGITRSRSFVQNGTSVTLHWPDSASLKLDEAKDQIVQIARSFAFLNPHATFRLEWGGVTLVEAEQTFSSWRKWRPDYITENDVDWDVVYDDRGHFREPHTGLVFGLGTLAVRQYLSEIGKPKLQGPHLATASIETKGPHGCFGAVMFIEKEGFDPLWESVNLQERFDISIKSTKGMSVHCLVPRASGQRRPRGTRSWFAGRSGARPRPGRCPVRCREPRWCGRRLRYRP
jgi:hypothetical protein